MKPIQALQAEIEEKTFAEVELLEAKLLDDYQKAAQDEHHHKLDKVLDELKDYSKKRAKDTIKAWTDLLPTLLTTYHDGYIATGLNETSINMVKIFYPYWWLQAVGYYKDRPNNWLANPSIIMFADQPGDGTTESSGQGVVSTVLVASLLSLAVGYVLGSTSRTKNNVNANGEAAATSADVSHLHSGTRGYQAVPEIEI